MLGLSVCYYALETDEKMNLVCQPKCFDMIVYDLDIPLPKEECVKLRAEDPKRFQQLLSTVRLKRCGFTIIYASATAVHLC